MPLSKKEKIICALDTKNIDAAISLIDETKEFIGTFKLGLEYFIANGPLGVGVIAARNISIFLDLKLYDIPNTVSKSVESLTKFKEVKMLTVHAHDEEIVRSAVTASKHIEIYGVTLLTSINPKNSSKLVLDRTEKALTAGAKGIVCSVKEVKKIRHKFGYDFKIAVPGIRWGEHLVEDHKRFGTPREAIGSGADYIIVGRPITSSKNPKSVAYLLLDEL